MENRYSWLSWKPIHPSRWLKAYLIASVPFILIPALVLEFHRNGGHVLHAYQKIALEKGSYRLATILVFADWAFLVWFVFFTKSKKVTDDDRLFVFIGILSWACVLVVMIMQSGLF